MALRAKVLQIKAEKAEAKKLQVHKVVKERVSTLDPLLQDVYDNRRPKPKDYDDRKNLISAFNEIAKEIYGNSRKAPIVVEFGSFVMDLFSNSSDLDLSVNFNINEVTFSREKKIQTLRKFAKKLYALQSNGHVYGVIPITTAKVPIVKCVDRGTGVECDISVENRDGISKSQIIHSISSIDERFHKLSFLMKTWAKANNINSSRDKTLNSLSLILLVAFHLQTRNPPILPPLSSILENGSDPISVAKLIPNFANYGKKNKESLAELFVTLLIKLSAIEKLWAKGLCASTCNATWTSKTWDTKVASFSVEDFTDRSQNVSRAVGQPEVKQIYKCINLSIQYVFAFMDGQIERERLQDLLFGQDGVPNQIPRYLHPIGRKGNQTRIAKRKQAMRPSRVVIPVQGFTGTQPPLQSCPAKKMRTLETGVGMPSRTWIAKEVSVVIQQPTAAAGGWGTQLPSGTGWGGGQLPSPDGWGGTQPPNQPGWGQPSRSVGWGGIQPPSQGGWGGTQPPSQVSWGGTQPPSYGGWGGTQPPSHGGWGGTQLPRGNGWGEASNPVGGRTW